MDKWHIGDKGERSAHAKMSTKSLAHPKMEEKKLQSVTALVFPSKKKDVSNLASRQFIQSVHLL